MHDPPASRTFKNEPSDPPSGGVRTQAVLYVVLEGERPLAGGARLGLASFALLYIGRARTLSLELGPGGVASLSLPDRGISSKHARLVFTLGEWTLQDLESTNGTLLDGQPIKSVVLRDGALFVLGATVFLFRSAEPATGPLPPLLEGASLAGLSAGVATLVPEYEARLQLLTRVAASTLSILLLGESGSGKEVLARAIHEISGRPGAFVAINCGALAPGLVESQLFGHLRGAFSGAVRDEPGLVRVSSGGTLFLDEIGDLPPPAQATLLRVLQEQEVLPVGGSRPVGVDLRVVAATLKSVENSPSFRIDLYARIAGFSHRLPSLRERRADTGLLVARLLQRAGPARAEEVRMSSDFARTLVEHDWPRNVRQLEHALSVSMITAGREPLRVEHAGDALARRSASVRPSEPGAAPVSDPDGERVKTELLGALERHRGNVSEVARELGRTRMQIHRWMKRFGVIVETFRR